MAPEGPPQFVAVTGSIAVGKTALVTRLADALTAVPLREEVDRNPYFNRFYEDPERWAFHSQLAFATDSLKRHAHAATIDGSVVQDRTVFEVVDVFSRFLLGMNDLDFDEFCVLAELRDCASGLIRQPTVVVYLHAPPATLLTRAEERGRPAESHLTATYLDHLQCHYETFIKAWSACPVLSVDTSQRDLRQDTELISLLDELQTAQEI